MRFTIGDMFQSDKQVIVNTVNCVGVMGKGIAAVFKKRFPANYEDYKMRCAKGEVRPGKPYLFEDPSGTAIINFPTKDHWRSPSRMSYVSDGLDWFVENWRDLGIGSIAFPPLGCGNGGLQWQQVGSLIYEKLSALPLDIVVYAPYGTPKAQLTEEFFQRQRSYVDVVGAKASVFNQKWDLVLRVIQLLDEDVTSLSVGRTAYQKICYTLTRYGVATGFAFRKGEYGPFSVDAKTALTIMANDNRIKEENLGSMIRISPSESFKFDQKRFEEYEIEAVEKTVDLFSRIRNTEQAEEVATLLFAHDQLKLNGRLVSEDQILRYIIEWKPRWDSSYKLDRLKREMFMLCSLGFMGVQMLTYLPEDRF